MSGYPLAISPLVLFLTVCWILDLDPMRRLRIVLRVIPVPRVWYTYSTCGVRPGRIRLNLCSIRLIRTSKMEMSWEGVSFQTGHFHGHRGF